jgi:ubiquinone/menaquinone biosynthesis C-methylase UbiE
MQETKYDKIGTGYNSTRQADPYLTERLYYQLQPKTDRLYLDIGCGTGNYTCTLADKGLNFIGVEPSEKMLSEAKIRNQHINWFKGRAEQIPTEDEVFDGIIATLTIHHWTDLKKAFAELDRVLVDNGKIVMFTSSPEQMKGYWHHNLSVKEFEILFWFTSFLYHVWIVSFNGIVSSPFINSNSGFG